MALHQNGYSCKFVTYRSRIVYYMNKWPMHSSEYYYVHLLITFVISIIRHVKIFKAYICLMSYEIVFDVIGIGKDSCSHRLISYTH